jgi:hypothetical protein
VTSAPGRNTPGFKGARGASVSGSLHSRTPVIQWGEGAVAHGPQAPDAARRQHRGIWPQFALPRAKPVSVCSARAERLAYARGLGPGPTAALPPPGALSLHLAARATAVGCAGTRAWHLRARAP